MRKNADYDWDTFRSEAYSDHNYATPRAADQWMTAQLATFYRDLPSGIDVVDIGTGPNLITLLAAIGRANSVIAWEFAVSNIAWLEETIANNRELPSHWEEFWNTLRSVAPDVYGNANPLDTLGSIVELRQASIFDLPERSWDAATMFFVAESITEDMAEFQDACRRCARAVRPGGSIAAAFMERSVGYATDDIPFPAVGVSIGDIATAFADEVDLIALTRVPDGGNLVRSGYEGMLFMTATVGNSTDERSAHGIRTE